MKIAVVVQRYGAEINGGAELHARYIAEHLARHVQVEVLTTCARDYITWANEYPAGESVAGGITVRRYPVSHPRDPKTFGDWSTRVFDSRHSVNDELAWLDAEGPTSPALVRDLVARQAEFEFVLFFSARYYHAYHGARALPGKAILVPTAERDEVLGLGIFPPVFRGVRAFMYNSPEERALLQAAAGTDEVPGVVVGVGSEVPGATHPERFRQKTGIHERTAIYIGRIDENKGCKELFDFWQRYAEITPGGLTLVLIGMPILPIPKHPRIRHLGFVSDQEKFDALAAAEFLIMPSYFESLSMVALEAWALGKPVLANGRCDVLRGQAARSNAGLYYESYPEFVEAMRVLDGSPGVSAALGRNGSQFFRANYAWPVIEKKYLDMFSRLRAEDPSAVAGRAMAPEPGWWGRRQRSLPPAREVLAKLPAGPVLGRAARDVQPAVPERPRDRRDAESAGRPATPHDATAATRTREPQDRAPQGGRESQDRDRRPRDARDGRSRDDRPRGERPRDGQGRDARDGQNRDGQGRDGRDRQRGRSGREGRERREGRQRSGRDDSRATKPAPPATNDTPPAESQADGQPTAPVNERTRSARAGRQRRGRRHGPRGPRKDGAA